MKLPNLTSEQFKTIVGRRNDGEQYKNISADFNVSRYYIKQAVILFGEYDNVRDIQNKMDEINSRPRTRTDGIYNSAECYRRYKEKYTRYNRERAANLRNR